MLARPRFLEDEDDEEDDYEDGAFAYFSQEAKSLAQ
jgi:hypothetical protein